jgi:L-alanine-DL-glutamate epimerase-like enolase superfamily enzyme
VEFFGLWQQLNELQARWAAPRGIPPLLAHLGVSLVERAALDGLCRAAGRPLHRLLAERTLDVRLGDVYPELGDSCPADWLPPAPRRHCFVRHTVGLADPLTPEDIPGAERVSDGLPQDLESSIRAYGLRYFKVKLTGDAGRDLPRLVRLQAILARETAGDFRLTLDGNENFRSFEAFREFWDGIRAEPVLRDFWRRVLAVEQPVHRDHALGDEAGAVLRAWPDHPPLIVDESDGATGDVPRALDLGYAGASHKNCKGIVKGLANAAVLEKRRREGQPGLLTGEDLANLGPVALLQDLALMALLGIEHVERNGHHYYRGLSMFPAGWQDATLEAHPDLYRRHADGFACLHIADGRISLASVDAAPFGVAPVFDPAALG